MVKERAQGSDLVLIKGDGSIAAFLPLIPLLCFLLLTSLPPTIGLSDSVFFLSFGFCLRIHPR